MFNWLYLLQFSNMEDALIFQENVKIIEGKLKILLLLILIFVGPLECSMSLQNGGNHCGSRFPVFVPLNNVCLLVKQE